MNTFLTRRALREHMPLGQMPYNLAMLTKVKNNLCPPYDSDLPQSLMGASLAHATPFHQVP